MSRRMLMATAMGLAIAVGATTSYAALWVQPPDPPEPPEVPRGGQREQPPMRPQEGMQRGMGGGGVQMTASGKFVYILRGDEILQFDGTSLEFIKKVKLPPAERPQRPGRDDERRPPAGEPKPPAAKSTPTDAASTLEQFAKAKPDAKSLAFYSLDWAPNLQEAQARAKAERRPVFLIANTNITAGCNFYTGHT